MLQFTQVFIDAGHLSLRRAFPSSPRSRNDDHLIKVLSPLA